MDTKQAIIEAVQARADVSGDAMRIALGTPGAHVPNVIGEVEETGQAWVEPAAFPTLVGGIADYLDGQGVSGVGAIRGKLNELVGQYNQLLADYNAGVVPSAAHAVVPL